MLPAELLRYLQANIGDSEMALVTQIGSSKKDRHSVHSPTTCLYSVFRGRDTRRYLQLDTYGSEDACQKTVNSLSRLRL